MSEVVIVSNSSSVDVRTSTLGEILKCFSLYSNIKNLVKSDLPPNSVTIIHGLKFFGMLWVIMVHAVFYQSDYLDNMGVAYRLSEDIFAQILSNSTYCVDTYLFLRYYYLFPVIQLHTRFIFSGFLLAYLFFMTKKNIDRISSGGYLKNVLLFFHMFMNRFLRFDLVL